MQRRNQKVVEETPAPGLTRETRERLYDAAVRLGSAVRYRSAGTVEFVYDVPTEKFYFLEVNPRLQVEHGVTEEVSGIDLVEWMIRVAAGEPPDLGAYRYEPRGHAIQVRLYAEDPSRNFRPSSGPLSHVVLPEGVRVDGWIETGTEVSSFYDPLLAKIIAHGSTRELALRELRAALDATSVYGVETNLEYLRAVLDTSMFSGSAAVLRGSWPEREFPAAVGIEVLRAGYSRQPCRILPGGSDSGMWVSRLQGRWTTWHSGSPTASWAIRRVPQGWSSREKGRCCNSASIV